ncbi:hypothetical protein OBBRIDRAFT_739765 [Obba rivulosa]|uniref:N-acetyltransferase domain-containing protein n=1 Tax=Obba rivulosa TaxID=1052685 RepID=A0A8E2DG25_9APHY|nr:hypothetical protein OBBRIDRAFT_739765 [Obba rivulosa]
MSEGWTTLLFRTHADAFRFTDPANYSFTAGNLDLLELMARAMLKPKALVSGEMYTATDENGDLVGFTIWLPPGRKGLTTCEERQMGMYQFMESLSPEGKEYYANALGKQFPKVVDNFIGIEQAEKSTYYCSVAMVRADYQGRGVLRALFELVSPKAEELSAPMALCTTNVRNVVIYEKLGFSMRGHQVMQSPWGGWPVWVFSRGTETG